MHPPASKILFMMHSIIVVSLVARCHKNIISDTIPIQTRAKIISIASIKLYDLINSN